jgi:hypothetical protein
MTRIWIVALIAGGSCGAAWAQDPGEAYLNGKTAQPGWTPLVLHLPPPMFVGTPRDINTPNLEPITGKQRKPFLAPPGTVNLAKGKKVTGSQPRPNVGRYEQIVDEDKLGSDGSFVELGSGIQWVQIDLGQRCALSAIVVWHYHMEGRVYFDVVVRAADDPDFIAGVKTLFNNDHDNTGGLGVGKDKEYIETNEGKLIDAGGVQTRYVRLYSNGNSSNELNHYIEVEIYGAPAK